MLLVCIRNRLHRRLASHGATVDLRHTRSTLQRELKAHHRSQLEAKARFFSAGPRRQGFQFWAAIKRWFRGPQTDLPPLQTVDGGTAITLRERSEALADHLQRTFGGLTDPSFDEGFWMATEAEVAADDTLQPLHAHRLCSPTLPAHVCTSDDEGADLPDGEPTRPVSPGNVSLLLAKLHPGKAPGLDGLSPNLLRHCPPKLAHILATIFTASLRVGYFPARWRTCAVRMIPKTGKALTSPGDFRPIALCSSIVKLLERIIARRLLAESRQRHLLPAEQSAFLPGHDMTEQLVLLLQRAAQSTNAGLTTLVALDANKAFDSVWHAGLLRCLRERQFLAPTRRWISSFLRSRTATLLEDSHLYRRFPVAAGVLQGSSLSPHLYILYTADMPLLRGPLTGASVYADDVALWTSGPSPAAALQRVRPVLHRAVRRIAFNPDKTQVVLSRRSQWPLDSLAPPHLMGV